MGGGRGGPKRGRTQRRHFRQNRENVWRKKNKADPSSNNNDNVNPDWQPFVTDNPSFEDYYKEQGIVGEEEWGEFLSILRKALPAAFRINSRIYYISRSVRDALRLNFLVGQQLKITSLGLKTFERQTSKDSSASCSFRISSEGLPLLLPYMSKQRICASLKDFEHLLKYRTIKFAEFVDAEFGEKASKLSAGGCVVLHKGKDPAPDDIIDESTIAIGWKGRTNLNVMVSELECRQLLERFSIQFSSLQEMKHENDDDGISSLQEMKHKNNDSSTS